jgi:mono/diheme cytochrome c family protein
MIAARLLVASTLLGVLAATRVLAVDQQNAKVQAVVRGSVVFQKYCSLCHGLSADGHGRAAKLHTPPPVDLRRSVANDQYRELIIKLGSRGVGRSAGMPPWKDELSETEIRDVIAFLAAISSKTKAR